MVNNEIPLFKRMNQERPYKQLLHYCNSFKLHLCIYFLSRRWVVVDNKDEHIRCYLHPVISQVTPRFEGDQLCLDAPGMETLKVNRKLNTNEYKDLRFVQ